MKLPLPAFASLLFALAARGQFTPAPKPGPLTEFPNAARARFGYVTVPESRSNPQDLRQISLAVIVVPSRSATPLPDPVFYIVGGPGGSATLSSDGFPIFAELNKTRDIVFVDPRGAGFSNPVLFMRRGGVTIGQFTGANRNFFQGQGIDPSAYNTTEIAQDYEAARVALGYGPINLFANSYGTFVAQEMLRRFPGSLRSVVMSGNLPATDPILPTTLGIEKAGIEAMLRDVESNGPARRDFPNFRQRFYHLIPRLNSDPVHLKLSNRDTGKIESVTIDGIEFLSTISELLQRTQTIRLIPLLVTQLDRGQYDALVARLFAPRRDLRRDNPFGMYLSVLGADFAAPGYVLATERGILGVRNRTLIRTEGPDLLQLARLVVSWGVPFNPGATRTLPSSPVRTLLLNGQMDAQTPVAGGASIAAGLPNATNLVYPRSGHAVGFDPGPAFTAAVAFIQDPTRPPVFSRGDLQRRHFYQTVNPVAKTRGVDDWRDHLTDLPISRLAPR
ncbi:MAG: alpha/beta fold hydrolase [Terrimicrobiaceae bacterium]|nr:alpha/beta fold hydrolase [Terrimicrobiaceae bacterium]